MRKNRKWKRKEGRMKREHKDRNVERKEGKIEQMKWTVFCCVRLCFGNLTAFGPVV